MIDLNDVDAAFARHESGYHQATCAEACLRPIDTSNTIFAACEADAGAGFHTHPGASHVVCRMREGSVWINDAREAVAC